MAALHIKRAYEKPSTGDGYRILVDRVWPRGVTKEKLALDEWAKELAPSTSLRKFFGHDINRWEEFVTRYRRELSASAAASAKLRAVADRAKKGPVTLVYGARDPEHNQAVVLKDLMSRAGKP